MNTTAFCWASGRIGFTTPLRTPHVPDGALPIITGPARKVRHLMQCCARHGHGKSQGVLLVPGVPEADTPRDACTALLQFRKWVTTRTPRKEGA